MPYEEWIIALNAPLNDFADDESRRAEAEAEMALFWGAKGDLGV